MVHRAPSAAARRSQASSNRISRFGHPQAPGGGTKQWINPFGVRQRIGRPSGFSRVFRDIGVGLVIEREVVADVVSQHGPDLHAVIAIGEVGQVGGAKPARLDIAREIELVEAPCVIAVGDQFYRASEPGGEQVVEETVGTGFQQGQRAELIDDQKSREVLPQQYVQRVLIRQLPPGRQCKGFLDEVSLAEVVHRLIIADVGRLRRLSRLFWGSN